MSQYNYKGDTLYDSVEIMPKLASSLLQAHLGSMLRYPDSARESGTEGKVIVGYVIDRDGAVGAVIVAKSSGSRFLDQEAVRVTWALPRYEPGRHQGQAVPVYLELPITFKLD